MNTTAAATELTSTSPSSTVTAAITSTCSSGALQPQISSCATGASRLIKQPQQAISTCGFAQQHHQQIVSGCGGCSITSKQSHHSNQHQQPPTTVLSPEHEYHHHPIRVVKQRPTTTASSNTNHHNAANHNICGATPSSTQSPPSTTQQSKKMDDASKLVKFIDESVIGKSNSFLGPFGRRKVIYCDYAASGRSLQFIEDFIQKEVLPCYGSTSSTTSLTSHQSSTFKNEARNIIKASANASKADAVLFTGHGCSQALQKLIVGLDLHEAPVIFTGPNESQDNLHVWQQFGAKIVRISETKDGQLNLTELENGLRSHQHLGKQLIGSFSVASSVTGITADDVSCTILLHQFNALSFWDYNTAAPYINVDMNPCVEGLVDNLMAGKDAVYFSTHKYPGGVQSPGILIAKRALLRRCHVYDADGGFFSSQEYNKSFEVQQEGTCAPVVESIRAGLVVQLKETVTVHNIMQRVERINKQMLQHIRTIPEIILLGSPLAQPNRLPIFSFLVRHPRGTFLHPNFVNAVLNDVFGIQARSGCPCSGTYIQELLGIDSNLADQYEHLMLEDRRLSSINLMGAWNSPLELLRPSFTRISLPYFLGESELAFVMEAVKMVATESWKLLPQYVVDIETGEWRHHSFGHKHDRKSLTSIRYTDGKMAYSTTSNERRISSVGIFPQTHSECLQTARNLFNRARRAANRSPYDPEHDLVLDARAERLRWFMLQHEAQSLLTSNAQNVKQNVPFDPILSMARHPKADSPRHFSLPCSVDDARLVTCASPVPYHLVHDVTVGGGTAAAAAGTAAAAAAPRIFYHHQPNFAVGETVSVHTHFGRDRCFSLGGNTCTTNPSTATITSISSPVTQQLSPQTRFVIEPVKHNRTNGTVGRAKGRRHLSSSQSEAQMLDSDANMSPSHSLNYIPASLVNDDSANQRTASPAPSDLKSYVTEMTKELATNIKSEIREVINKVEDVLENGSGGELNASEMIPNRPSSSVERQGTTASEDSISANDVAEYLEKVSIEMANEVKLELRDVVSAVDVFITPENSSANNHEQGAAHVPHTPGSSSDTVIYMLPNDHKSPKLKKPMSSTVASVSSQDSGINLSFHDTDLHQQDGSAQKARSNSESLSHRHSSSDSGGGGGVEHVKFATLHRCPNNKSDSWPKAIWQPMLEAIHEFDMIKDGDKVMVCLSGGRDSLTLLHTLLQYQNYVTQAKGLLFSLGAVTVDPDTTGCDPCVLIPHLRSLGVHYIIDDKKCDPDDEADQCEEAKENLYSFRTAGLRHRLYAAAKSSGYNVLGVGQHLDDLCENFLLSAFHTGKLRAMRAHYLIKEHNLRVIRPLVYVRDKYLKQFAINRNLPVNMHGKGRGQNMFSSLVVTKERQRIRQLLIQQEIAFPRLFQSLRNAIRPLIGFQIKEDDTKRSRKRLRMTDSTDECSSEDIETDEEPVAQDST